MREHLTTNNGDPQMNLKKLFHKKTKTDTGIQNITKKQHNNDLHYIYTDKNQIKVMSYLDLLLKSLEQDNIDIIVDDENLFNESILESRHNHYQKQCDMMGVINDKDPDSFYDNGLRIKTTNFYVAYTSDDATNTAVVVYTTAGALAPELINKVQFHKT